MYKIKKKTPSSSKQPTLYNIIEDYSEFDPPGNVTVCATTEPEDREAHARILSESYQIPLEVMTRLLVEGGIYVYPQAGLLVTQGLFACEIDPSGALPKQTWVLDVQQYTEAEQLAQSYRIPIEEAASRVFHRTLPSELQSRFKEKNLELNDTTSDRAVTNGNITYIDFRKDWSPHFKRLCIMPDGRLIETGGVGEFAALHGISLEAAKNLIEHGGTLEVDGEVLACQIVNGQPAVARFSRRQYEKAKTIVSTKHIHLMDALSEVGLRDPSMMRALKRLEQRSGATNRS